jgi:threonine aldolase
MRQVGVLASCGLIGLKDMSERLCEDHANAKRFYEVVAAEPGVIITHPDTNIVKFSLSKDVYPQADLGSLANHLSKQNVYMITVDEGRSIRAVMHYHITAEDVEEAANVVCKALQDIRAGNLVLAANSVRMY